MNMMTLEPQSKFLRAVADFVGEMDEIIKRFGAQEGIGG